MRFFLSYSLAATLLTTAACQSTKNTMSPSSSQEVATTSTNTCGSTAQTIKAVKGQAGTVYYNSSEKQYTIIVTTPNTIDSQDIGLVCNLPANLRVDGLKVIFDGEYKPYDKTPAAMTGGQSFYYLSITKLSSEKGNI